MLAEDYKIPESHVLRSKYGFDQQTGLVTSCGAVTDAQKAQFVQRHRSVHALTVGVGDSHDRDGPFLLQCAIPVLFVPGPLNVANPNYFTMSSFGVLNSFLGSLSDTATYRTQKRPSLFIGSSSEGRQWAEALHALMDDTVDATIWTHGVFEPSATYIESLEEARHAFDFAVILLTADDHSVQRDTTYAVPRDNLVFELGLFTGALGRRRCLIVAPDTALKLPSDLAGVEILKYNDRRGDKNRQAALQTAATRIRHQMLGPT